MGDEARPACNQTGQSDVATAAPKDDPGTSGSAATSRARDWRSVVPALALIVSIFALSISWMAHRFARGYIRPHEDHDVVVKVLGVYAPTKGFSSLGTNGEIFVDLAFINRGNQREIIRDAFLCFADSNDFSGTHWTRIVDPSKPGLNIQLDKGDRQVVRLLNPFDAGNTGRRMWLGVGVRVIAPNADDVEVRWPVCEINLAPDGNGSWWSYDKASTPSVRIISNERLPHQQLARDGF